MGIARANSRMNTIARMIMDVLKYFYNISLGVTLAGIHGIHLYGRQFSQICCCLPYQQGFTLIEKIFFPEIFSFGSKLLPFRIHHLLNLLGVKKVVLLLNIHGCGQFATVSVQESLHYKYYLLVKMTEKSTKCITPLNVIEKCIPPTICLPQARTILQIHSSHIAVSKQNHYSKSKKGHNRLSSKVSQVIYKLYTTVIQCQILSA